MSGASEALVGLFALNEGDEATIREALAAVEQEAERRGRDQALAEARAVVDDETLRDVTGERPHCNWCAEYGFDPKTAEALDALRAALDRLAQP